MNLEPDAIAIRHADAAVTIEIALHSTHPLFDGHFDQQPILSAVGQLHWAIQAAQRHLHAGPGFESASALKFKRVILAPATLTLHLIREAVPCRFTFRYSVGPRECSSGRLQFCDE